MRATYLAHLILADVNTLLKYESVPLSPFVIRKNISDQSLLNALTWNRCAMRSLLENAFQNLRINLLTGFAVSFLP
jgi:hypothetical protein